MKELLIYLAHVSLLTACAYAAYITIFGRDTFHGIKRFLLLSIIVLCFALPVCRITVYKEAAVQETSFSASSYPIIQRDTTDTYPVKAQEKQSPFDWIFLAGIIYATGAAAMLAYRLGGVLRVRSLIKKPAVSCIREGIEIVLVPKDISPFSYRNTIIMSPEDYDNHAEMIIRHESVHIKQLHSIDLLFINLILAMQWFNPFMWLLRRELIFAHECAADEGVLKSGIDAKQYQYLLISKSACGSGLISVANHFCSSDLLKRIRTMKRKTSKRALLKLLLLVPLVSIALTAFAETAYKSGSPTNNDGYKFYHMPFEGKIAGAFGKSKHPVTGSEIIHTGIDVILTNDTVRAPMNGSVKSLATDKTYGKQLILSHGTNAEIMYGHLSEFLVKEGDAVRPGEPVAITGSTGMATGKHLHFEYRIDGEPRDPNDLLQMITIYNEPMADGEIGRIITNEIKLMYRDTIRIESPGTVKKAGYSEKCGYMVHIQYPDNIEEIHGFLGKVLVSEGDKLERGSIIAIIGDTDHYPKSYYLETRIDGRQDKIQSFGGHIDIHKLKEPKVEVAVDTIRQICVISSTTTHGTQGDSRDGKAENAKQIKFIYPDVKESEQTGDSHEAKAESAKQIKFICPDVKESEQAGDSHEAKAESAKQIKFIYPDVKESEQAGDSE